VWNEETLTEWLKAPTKFISGVRMVYRLNNEQDIADVIAYLKANSPDAE
jgi:cytochrome c2